MLHWASLGCSLTAVPFFQVFKLVSTQAYTWSVVPLQTAITTNPLHIRILNSWHLANVSRCWDVAIAATLLANLLIGLKFWPLILVELLHLSISLVYPMSFLSHLVRIQPLYVNLTVSLTVESFKFAIIKHSRNLATRISSASCFSWSLVFKHITRLLVAQVHKVWTSSTSAFHVSVAIIALNFKILLGFHRFRLKFPIKSSELGLLFLILLKLIARLHILIYARQTALLWLTHHYSNLWLCALCILKNCLHVIRIEWVPWLGRLLGHYHLCLIDRLINLLHKSLRKVVDLLQDKQLLLSKTIYFCSRLLELCPL